MQKKSKYKGVLQHIGKKYIQNDIWLKHLALFGGPQRIFIFKKIIIDFFETTIVFCIADVRAFYTRTVDPEEEILKKLKNIYIF